MVEVNYSQNGYEYGFDFDKTVFILYLKKNEKRMFEILITYNEFLRAPDIFKDFIKAPKKLNNWNFWCKELKYRQKKFDKKFQTKK